MFNSYQPLVVFALPSTMPHTIMSVQCRTQCSNNLDDLNNLNNLNDLNDLNNLNNLNDLNFNLNLNT